MRVLILTMLVWGCAQAAPGGPEGDVDLASVARVDLAGPKHDLWAPPEDMAGNASYGYPRVNEVVTEADGVTQDEYIELVGANVNIALFNWTLVYQSPDGSSTQVLVMFPQAVTLPARGYLVIAAAGSRFAAMAGAKYTAPAGGLLAAAGGAVALIHSGTTVDSVGWGTAVGTYVEGGVSAAGPGSGGASRLPDGVDTSRNRDDFRVAPLTPGAANHL